MSKRTQENGNGKLRVVCLFFACIIFMSPSFAASERLRVGFLCPAPADNPFWSQVTRVMRAAAEDLDIELIVRCSERGSLATKRIGNELLNTTPKLDYLLTGYWPLVTKSHLELAQKLRIKVFVFNAEIRDDERDTVGFPRQYFQNWIGHMIPDDKQSSDDLTRMLITRARETRSIPPDGEVRVLALTGIGSSAVGSNRAEGLRTRVAATPGVVLHEIGLENWLPGWARDETAKFLKNNPHTDVVWGVSQASTWGAVQGVEQSGGKPGRDVVVGGFDWNPDSLQAISEGKIAALMSGHFIEGAWALILIHDYHYGLDFVDSEGIRILTQFSPITLANYPRYKVLLNGKHWDETDFRKFSKKYNPQLKSYNFSIEQFLE
jgi:ABC-type sugar transport system substrate-binding protein